MSKKLVPGLESYMEENDIDVEVNVGDPAEVAEEETEAVEAATDVESTDGEVQEEATEAEMIFRRYDELERMQAHLQKYGASREFMAWHNHNGFLADALGIHIPAAESLDATGDPYSSLSIACMEGIGEALKSVWEFIKKVCRKIATFFARIVEAIVRAFSSLDSNVGRLRKAYEDRTKDLDKIKEFEANMFKDSTLTQYYTKITNMETRYQAGQIFGQIRTTVTNMAGSFQNLANTTGAANQQTRQLIEDLDREEQRKFGGDKDKFKLADRPSPSNMKFETGFNPETVLTDVSKEKRKIDEAQAINKIVQDTMKTCLSVAEKAEKRDDDGAKEVARDFRRLISLANRVSSRESKFISDKMWVLNKRVRNVSIFIVNCMKKM